MKETCCPFCGSKKKYVLTDTEIALHDEYKEGFGLLKSVDVRARIMARQEAWKAIGINPSGASWLCNYNIPPKELCNLIINQRKKVKGVGAKTISQLKILSENDFEKFIVNYKELYNNPNSWINAVCVRWKAGEF